MENTNQTKNVKFSSQNDEITISDQESEDEQLSRGFNKFQFLEDSEDVVEHQIITDPSDSESGSEEPSLSQKVHATAGKKKQSRRRRGKGKKNKKSSDMVQLASEVQNNVLAIVSEKSMQENKNTNQLKLLKLDMRNLIPDNEVKRMFGKDVLREERSREGRARIQGMSSSAGVQKSRFIASGYHDLRMAFPTSSPKMDLDNLFNEQESALSGSIERQSNPEQAVYFRFIHDKAYQVIHANFLDAAQRGHSERVIQNLNLHPTHIESLLQLSDMIRVSEDYKAAGDLIERALLIFERGFHPKFNMATATCRLSYKRPENRTFFITLFKHISYCNRRGLRRTPLEYTKLLLSLEPRNDPLFATLLIDFYALRSEEFDFLIELISEWQHLADLPNMRFSLALAHFLKSRKIKSNKATSSLDLKKADDLLKEALILYPNFITKLLDLCSAEPDAGLKKCDYFDYTICGRRHRTVPEPVELMLSVYTHRNLSLWKAKPVMSWFERIVAELVAQFADGSQKDENRHLQIWSTFEGQTPRNLLRHIVLSDMSVKVPPSATRASVLDIDPYPPESIVSYRIQTVSNEPSSSSGSSLLGLPSLFLRSMMPNFRQERVPGPGNAIQIIDVPPIDDADMAQVIDEQLVLQQQLMNNSTDSTVGLDRLQQSIHSVLSSLSTLLAGTNAQPTPEEDPDRSNERPNRE